MGSPFNPIRDQVRSEMLSALANGATMTTNELYSVCPSAVDARDVSRLAYELRKKGVIASGEPVLNALGVRVNSFFLPTTTDPRLAAAKPIVVERKIPRTVKGTKPVTGHPFQAPISPRAPQERHERVTRDLPIHLTTMEPQMAADPIHRPYHEPAMSEDPMPYDTNSDTFSQEPMEPEAERDIDDELTSLLSEVEALKPAADAMMMASEYVGELTDAMARRREELTRTGVLSETPKVCQCLRINRLPPLPKGYAYGGIKVWIESEHDVGHLTIATHDEGGGAFASIKAAGRLSFDPGDLVTIGQVADALIRLHEEMGDNHE
jgi:hypothetical protein